MSRYRGRVHLTFKSKNTKTGDIPVSTTEQGSCPPGCPFKGNGCYAENHPLIHVWRAVTRGDLGNEWWWFCAQVAGIAPKTVWRHNQAGDLPAVDGVLDRQALGELVDANEGKRGFTYTHHPVTGGGKAALFNTLALLSANKRGFTVNVSTESLAQADEAARRGLPVVTVIPEGSPKLQRTPDGRPVVACPAQYRDEVTCKSCKLCANPNRPCVVGFYVHGARKSAANEALKEAA